MTLALFGVLNTTGASCVEMTPVVGHRRQWCWDNTMSVDNPNEQDSGGHTCPTCGDTFERDTAMKSHHRHVHGEKIGGVELTCDGCGDKITKHPSEVTEDGVNACSYECQQRALGHGSRSEYECDYCGAVFTRRDAKVTGEYQFCDRECHMDWRSNNIRGEAHPNYATGAAFDTNCSYCGSSLRKTADYADHKHHFCDSDCYAQWMSENRTGQDHPSWRGGKHLIDAVRKQLRPSWWTVRDDERAEECYKCGAPDCKLDVHHIVPISAGGTHNSWNLMTLCESCHQTVEAYTRTLPGMEAIIAE